MRLLLLLIMFLSACGSAKDKEVSRLREGIKIVQLKGTDICLVIYNKIRNNLGIVDGVSMLRVDCKEVPNPLVVPVDQALEEDKPM